jgi:general secretion pathway protein A
VYQKSGGTPRVINAICDRALLIGYTKEARTISAAIVKRAAREVRGEKPPSEHFWAKVKRNFVPSPSLAVGAALVVLLLIYIAPTLGALGGIAREMRAFNTILTVEEPPKELDTAPTHDAGLQTVEAEIEPEEGAEVSKALAEAEASVVVTRVLERLIPEVVPEPEVVVAPSPGEQFRAVLSEADGEETRAVALAALLAAWEVEPADGATVSDSPASIASYLEGVGLAQEHLTPAVDQLVAVDLPSLVLLNAGEEKRWVGLMASDGNSFGLTVTGDEIIDVPRNDFVAQFAGEVIIPWRDPTRSKYALTLGLRSDTVAQFRSDLGRLGRLPTGAASDLYDQSVASAVAKIQAQTGLLVDGMAGKQVRMIVQSWLPDTGTPSLRDGLLASSDEAIAPEVEEVPAVAKLEVEEVVSSIDVTQVPASENEAVAGEEAAVVEEAEPITDDFESAPAPSVSVEKLPDPFLEPSLAAPRRSLYKAVTPTVPGNLPLLPHGARRR